MSEPNTLQLPQPAPVLVATLAHQQLPSILPGAPVLRTVAVATELRIVRVVDFYRGSCTASERQA